MYKNITKKFFMALAITMAMPIACQAASFEAEKNQNTTVVNKNISWLSSEGNCVDNGGGDGGVTPEDLFKQQEEIQQEEIDELYKKKGMKRRFAIGVKNISNISLSSEGNCVDNGGGDGGVTPEDLFKQQEEIQQEEIDELYKKKGMKRRFATTL